MDAIEKAIRNAFEKGDPEDRAFREKVYRSAFAALDRALKTHPNLTVEAAIIRRKSLQAKIAEIETEFMPAIRAARAAPPPMARPVQPPRPAGAVPPPAAEIPPRPAAPQVQAVQPGPPPAQRPPPQVPQVPQAVPVPPPDPRPSPPVIEPVSDPGIVGRTAQEIPSISVEPPGARGVEPVSAPGIEMADERPVREPGLLAGDPRAGDRQVAAAGPDRPRRRSRFATLFLIVTLLTAAAIGAWWAYKTGLFKSPQEIDTSVPNPPATTEEEDFTPLVPEETGDAGGDPARPGEIDQRRNWITVFTPEDPSLANAPAGASAEVNQDDFGSYLRISSSGDAVMFDVGQGVLEQVAGKKVVFEIVARAEDGKPTQMSVTCDLGELGDCGRKRYDVVAERAEYLWELTLPATRPGAAGTIAIVPDLDNQGKAVQIYEIRTAVSQ